MKKEFEVTLTITLNGKKESNSTFFPSEEEANAHASALKAGIEIMGTKELDTVEVKKP